MSRWLVAHVQALERALKRLRAQPLVSLLSILVIGIAIMLPLGFYTLMSNISNAAGKLNTEPHINVFLTMSASEAEAENLEQRLKSLTHVADVRFISRESALTEMKQATNFADLLTGLEGNPLPHAFVIRPDTLEPALLSILRKEIAGLPKVDSVNMDFEWAQKLQRFIRFAERLAYFLGLLLALAVLFVTGNTIRLQILTQKDEIEVSQLIGATREFIRRPFLYFGAIQGLLAGVVAWITVVSLTHWIGNEVAALTATYGSNFALKSLDEQSTLSLLFCTTLLGWLGAYLSVSLYLRHPGNTNH